MMNCKCVKTQKKRQRGGQEDCWRAQLYCNLKSQYPSDVSCSARDAAKCRVPFVNSNSAGGWYVETKAFNSDDAINKLQASFESSSVKCAQLNKPEITWIDRKTRQSRRLKICPLLMELPRKRTP